MVGPLPAEDRARAMLKLKLAIAATVGASGGLVALKGDAGPTAVAVAAIVGFVVGVALVWLVFPDAGEVTSSRTRR